MGSPIPQALRIPGDGVELAVYRWPRSGAPTLVLVHGYPDNHRVWLPLIELLAPEYDLIAYDVRGAGASGRPHGRRAYRLQHLARDFEAVVTTLVPDRQVHVVAHDWGSVQVWEAVTDPQIQRRIASFTSISGPCLDHVGHRLRGVGQSLVPALKQLMASWYLMLFHVPVLPELVWRMGLGRVAPHVLARIEAVMSPSGVIDADDACAGLGLYRANVLSHLWRPRMRATHVPVQLIVPQNDWFVRPQLHDELERWVTTLTRFEVAAGHWTLLAAPQTLAERVRLFVADVPMIQPIPQ